MFSSLIITSSRQCHRMVEYVIEHGQHESMLLWSNGARFTPELGTCLSQKPVGNKGLTLSGREATERGPNFLLNSF